MSIHVRKDPCWAEHNAQALLIINAQCAIEEDAKKHKWAGEARREFVEERAELLALLMKMKNSVEKLKDMHDLAVFKLFKVRVKEILLDVGDLIRKRA